MKSSITGGVAHVSNPGHSYPVMLHVCQIEKQSISFLEAIPWHGTNPRPFTYQDHHSHAGLLFQSFLLEFLRMVLDPDDDLAASISSPLHHMTV